MLELFQIILKKYYFILEKLDLIVTIEIIIIKSVLGWKISWSSTLWAKRVPLGLEWLLKEHYNWRGVWLVTWVELPRGCTSRYQNQVRSKTWSKVNLWVSSKEFGREAHSPTVTLPTSPWLCNRPSNGVGREEADNSDLV